MIWVKPCGLRGTEWERGVVFVCASRECLCAVCLTNIHVEPFLISSLILYHPSSSSWLGFSFPCHKTSLKRKLHLYITLSSINLKEDVEAIQPIILIFRGENFNNISIFLPTQSSQSLIWFWWWNHHTWPNILYFVWLEIGRRLIKLIPFPFFSLWPPCLAKHFIFAYPESIRFDPTSKS